MSAPPTRLHLALVAWRALPAVFPATGCHVGGLETGAWELAQGLVHDAQQQVTLVTEHQQPIRTDRVQGVELHVVVNRWKAMREDFSKSVDVAGGIRFKRFSWRLLYQFPLLLLTRPWRPADPPPLAPDPRLLDIRCDVWAAFGVNQDAARVVATAQRQQRPSILFLESNADVSPQSPAPQLKESQSNESQSKGTQPGNATATANAYGVTAAEREYCLRQATAVVCQSRWQMRHLQNHYGRQGTLIRNPIRLERWAQSGSTATGPVLWIGRYDDFHKRPLLALEIARLCPEIPFRMIVNASSPQIAQQVRGARPANVTLVDYVPYDRMPAEFRQARMFLSTSAASQEGFPNVILQAAASQTPIVSLEDFDEFIESSGAGCCSGGDVVQAARLVQATWAHGSQPNAALVSASLRDFEQPVVARQVAQLAAELFDLNARPA